MRTRREFLGDSLAFAVSVSAFRAPAAVGEGFDDWLAPKIDATLARCRAWKGSDEAVLFPVMTDLHDWTPDLDSSGSPGATRKAHILHALRVGEAFEADFVADLGDMGSDRVCGEDRKVRGASRDEQRRRWKSQFELYDRTARPVFCCVGNHDLGYVEGGKWQAARSEEFGAFFSPLAHGAQVVWGPGRHYGFWDVPDKSCRVIVLNDFEHGHSYGYTRAQLDFLAEALVVPAGVTVVALLHGDHLGGFGCWLKDGTMKYRDQSNGVYANMGLRECERMFEDFVAHGKGAVNGVSWDFSMLKGNRLAGIVCGHSHYDNYSRKYDVLRICRQGLGSLGLKTEMPHENGACHRDVYPSTRETCVDVVAVKPKTGELRIFRVGVGDAAADF